MTGSGSPGQPQSSLIALAGIGVLLLFALGTHSCLQGLGFDMLGGNMFHGWRFFPYSLLSLGGLLQIALALWVGYDAHKRGLNGVLWGLLVLFTLVVGLIVYLIVVSQSGRADGGPFAGTWAASAAAPPGSPVGATATPVPPNPATSTGAETCPHCSAETQPDFKLCPYCAGSLRCASCDTQLQKDWKVCPKCGTGVPKP